MGEEGPSNPVLKPIFLNQIISRACGINNFLKVWWVIITSDSFLKVGFDESLLLETNN